jgi:hypothetical protein
MNARELCLVMTEQSVWGISDNARPHVVHSSESTKLVDAEWGRIFAHDVGYRNAQGGARNVIFSIIHQIHKQTWVGVR